MISDVLSDTVAEMRRYLAEFPECYDGEVRPHLDKLIADMEAMRIKLDTPPPPESWSNQLKPASPSAASENFSESCHRARVSC